MSNILQPPINTRLIDDKGNATLPWVLYFNSLTIGDTGRTWIPTLVGLTETGVATKTGVYYKISQTLIYFRVIITPATDTSAIIGSTYIDNLPITINADGACDITTGTSFSGGTVTSATNRINMPTWTAITTPITITGVIEAS